MAAWELHFVLWCTVTSSEFNGHAEIVVVPLTVVVGAAVLVDVTGWVDVAVVVDALAWTCGRIMSTIRYSAEIASKHKFWAPTHFQFGVFVDGCASASTMLLFSLEIR